MPDETLSEFGLKYFNQLPQIVAIQSYINMPGYETSPKHQTYVRIYKNCSMYEKGIKQDRCAGADFNVTDADRFYAQETTNKRFELLESKLIALHDRIAKLEQEFDT